MPAPMLLRHIVAILALVTLALPVAASDIIRLATTTSTYNSGLLDYLLPAFEAEHPYQVHVIAVGTGKALRMGRDGDVDVVMTHAPKAEQAFVDAGYGVEPRSLMANDFVMVGPQHDPAAIRQAENVGQAFSRIASSEKSLFISRGDDSGTHKKELAIWDSLERQPDFDGYRAVGQGMGKVLQMASELQGYTLTDRGTWLALRDKLELTLLFEGGERLENPYQIILVNPQRYDDLNVQGARALSEWLVSEEGQAMIDGFEVEGEQLFFSTASPPTP